MLGKVQLLEQQFHMCSLDVVGIQKERGKTSCAREGLYYHMLIAAADEYGNHGVQCWLARDKRIKVIQWKAMLTTLMFLVALLRHGVTAVI